MSAHETRAELITDVGRLEELSTPWDELASASAKPYCTPGWLLPWWRHAAPDGASLSAVAVFEGRRLLGIAPFFFSRGRFGVVSYRLLGAGTSLRVEPLAQPGYEPNVAAAVAAALAAARPSPDLIVLEGIDAHIGWPELLRQAWPGRAPWLHDDESMPAPTLLFAGTTHDEWLAGRSSKFRKGMRYTRRQLEKHGAVFRLSNGAERAEDLRSFARLHHERWRARGGSGVLNAGVERMLDEAALRLGDRFRLYAIDIDGRTIATEIFLSCGGELACWLGGFDEAWAAQQPSMHTILTAIDDGFRRDERRLDLGAGGQSYKYRFADGEDVLRWATLVPKGRRSMLARLALLPTDARRRLSTRLPPRVKDAVKRLLRRR